MEANEFDNNDLENAISMTVAIIKSLMMDSPIYPDLKLHLLRLLEIQRARAEYFHPVKLDS